MTCTYCSEPVRLRLLDRRSRRFHWVHRGGGAFLWRCESCGERSAPEPPEDLCPGCGAPEPFWHRDHYAVPAESRVAWKVVKWDAARGVWVSDWAQGPLSVAYQEGAWVKAPVGGLFAYRTLEDARKAIRGRSQQVAVFRAEGAEQLMYLGDAWMLVGDVESLEWVKDAESVLARVCEWWARVPDTVPSTPAVVCCRRLRLLERVD